MSRSPYNIPFRGPKTRSMSVKPEVPSLCRPLQRRRHRKAPQVIQEYCRRQRLM